ncbi:2-dehydro-3-deoxygalactonokinase [Daejeonella rubra]|uniref:2-dehydro-3-deoxygalactonokinase n=1 Tax=Daejeonella rubra TaxID=990371 RepID=A0A1G9SHA2_9SPHI|nr:2-dehydro-3-deoxygalactonokinase [Daejeonella rubra]SDM34687.1 2-dehydro-3-deoxygalactonokinase [Daejeonella rubra]
MDKYILCCDWGTTSFRLRLVERKDYRVLAELLSKDGVAGTFRAWKEQNELKRFDFYAAILKGSIGELAKKSSFSLDNIPVIVSGMASSSIGMEEIPYAELPFDSKGSQASVRSFKDFNGAKSPLVLVSGVKSHEDVMRGEEAQLIGLLKLNEITIHGSEEIIFVFPGTHSKHIVVKDGFVTDFQTFMTGEIYNILCEHSILKDSVLGGSGAGLKDQVDINAFLKGVEVSGTSSLLHSLFTVRTGQLFGQFSKEQNSFYLSGLLIGSELRQLKDGNYDRLVICSGKHLYDHYKLAAEAISLKFNTTYIQPDLIDKATIAGQVQIFNALQTASYE